MAGPKVGERYELRRRLDQREGIVVFEGWDEQQGKPVQALLLRVSGSGSGEEQTRLLQFARLAGQVGTMPPPVLPALLDSGSSSTPENAGETLYYLIADWVEGQNLEGQLPLEPERAVMIVTTLAEGLKWARGRFGSGAPRYDLDPTSLVTDEDGSVRVSSFSPPGIGGEADSEQGDIAILGNLLRSLLAGGASEATRKLSAAQALALAQVIGRSTAPLGNRYPTIDQFLDALQQALAGKTTPAPVAVNRPVSDSLRRPPAEEAVEFQNFSDEPPTSSAPTLVAPPPPSLFAAPPPVTLPPLDVPDLEPFSPDDAFGPAPFEDAPPTEARAGTGPQILPGDNNRNTSNLVAAANFTPPDQNTPLPSPAKRVTVVTAADFDKSQPIATGTRATSFGDERFGPPAELNETGQPAASPARDVYRDNYASGEPARRSGSLGGSPRLAGRPTDADSRPRTGEIIVAKTRPHTRTAGLRNTFEANRLPWLVGGGIAVLLLLLLVIVTRNPGTAAQPAVTAGQITATASAASSSTALAMVISPTSAISLTSLAFVAPTATPLLLPTDTVGAAVPSAPTATPCALRFSDVPQSDDDYTPIMDVACRGVVFAPNGGAFEKERPVTRAEMAHALVTALDLPPGNPAVLSGSVGDVSETTPFYTDIVAVVSNGGMSGAGGRFNPNQTLTRIQAIAAIVRTNQWQDEPGPGAPHYSDVQSNDLLYKQVERAYSRNVIGGGGELRKNAPATRKDVALMIFNMLQSANQ